MPEPQQAGLSSVPNVGPMLAGGMPFGGMPSAANAASNRLGAQQFAGMGAGFAMNRTGLNANMGGMRASAGACGSNGFSGMGAVMRGNAPGQGAMQMGSPYMCMNGMMGTSAGLQAHGGYAQSSDLLAMINKGNMPGMGPGGLGELGGADLAVGPQFDMSDFPALANRVAMSLQQQPMQPAGMHRAAVAAMQPPEPEFAIQSEDFPALPGVAPKGRDVFAQQGGLGVGSRAHVPSDGGGGHGQHGGLIHGLLDLRHAHHMQPSHVEPGQLLAQQQQQTHKRTPPGVASGGGSGGGDSGSGSGGSMEPYGLLGLLHVIRVTDADLNYLALGTDLTTLGLNLNSPDPLYGTFASPWADGPVRSEPEYSLPQCYYMQPPALKTSHFGKFQLETLFYIFYNMPRDTLQAYAATELYNREWRYHKDLKLWFTRTGAQPGADDGKGGYVFFDINTWGKKTFQGAHAAGGAGQAGGDGESELSAGMDEGSGLVGHS